jgi:hypothetical protein
VGITNLDFGNAGAKYCRGNILNSNSKSNENIRK